MTFAADAGVLTDDMVGAVGVLTDWVSTSDHDELAVLTRQVARLRAAIDRCSLAITRRSAALHQTGAGPDPEDLWNREGGTSANEARQQRRRADTCADAPGLGDAVEDGTVTAAHLDVVARLLSRLDTETKAAFRAVEAEVTTHAQQLSVEEFEHWCRHRIERLGAELGRRRHERQRRDTRLRRWTDRSTGMYHLSGVFHPDLGVRLFSALDDQIDQLRTATHTSDTLQPGDPLGPVDDLSNDRDHLAAHALAGAVLHRARAQRPGRVEMTVIVDADTLTHGPHDHTVSEYADGTPLPHDTLRRLACFAELHRVLWSVDSEDVDVGRGSRLATRSQRRLLRARYRTCAWHGCQVRFDHCEIHHLHPWETGGATDLANLLPLCVRHHHHAHELGWTLALDAQRRLTIRQPNGTVWAITDAPTLRPPHAPPPHSPPRAASADDDPDRADDLSHHPRDTNDDAEQLLLVSA